MSLIKKTVAYLCVVSLLSFGAVSLVTGEEQPSEVSDRFSDDQADRAIEYKINSYTSPEPNNSAAIAPREIPSGFELAGQTDSLELYIGEQMQSFMIKNKRTGYVWSSVPDEKWLKEEKLNEEWGSAVRSPFLLEYFDQNAMLKRGSYRSLGATTESMVPVPGGMKAVYAIESLGIKFSMEVKLENDSLVVRFADQDIVENGSGKLASIQPLPFLGAVRNNEIPGYMFIPDGSGALIRFQATHPRYDQAYEGRVYGMDYAIEYSDLWAVNEQPILMPVFGLTHGVKQNSFLGIIEDGKYSARINAYPSGVNTGFYWVSPKFMLRYPYFQRTSKNMGGFNTFQANRNQEDRQVRYLFQSGQDADYVGMAKAYRSYLNERGAISPKQGSDGNIPLNLEMLGADKEPGIIGNRIVKMTSFDEAEKIVDDLRGRGIDNLSVVFTGWGKGGQNGSNPDKFPVGKELGGEKGLVELKNRLADKGVPLFLYNDYTNAYGSNGNFRPNADGIRTAGNEVLQETYYLWVDQESSSDLTVYFINPKVASSIAAKDAERFGKMGMDSVAIGKTGRLLLSDHHPQKRLSRKQSAEEYAKLAGALREKLDNVGFYTPNEYLWPYTTQMFEMPMYSSQYMFATDTVPFLQIVLHGSVDYFAPPANYNANPKEYLLRMVEYGAYPSFKVTSEPSWKLKYTLSNYMFTSYYEDWKEEIVSTYERMNEALRQVQDATIEQRNMLDWGVVEVVYSNGVKIIVNYRTKDVQYENRTVPGMDFILAGGE